MLCMCECCAGKKKEEKKNQISRRLHARAAPQPGKVTLYLLVITVARNLTAHVCEITLVSTSM